MKNEVNLKKRLFAIEYFKNGLNASAAALAVGYSKKSAKQRGSQLLKDETVQSEIKTLSTMFGLDKLTDINKDEIKEKIADISEILERLTRIVRREEPEETVVVLKRETTEYSDGDKSHTKEEYASVVETKTRVADVNKAADLLLKYYSQPASSDDESRGGVIILAPVKENTDG